MSPLHSMMTLKNYLLTSQYSYVLIHIINAYTLMNKMYVCHQGQQWIAQCWYHWWLIKIKHSHNSLTTIIKTEQRKDISMYSYWIVDTQLVIHSNNQHVTFTLVKKSVHCNGVHFRSALFWDIKQCRMVAFTDVLRQRISRIFSLGSSSPRRMLGTLRYAVYIENGECSDWFSENQSLNCLTLANWTDRSSQNAGKKLSFCAVQNPNKSTDLNYTAALAQNHTQYTLVFPHFHIPCPKRNWS
jgi:hypothetical protein